MRPPQLTLLERESPSVFESTGGSQKETGWSARKTARDLDESQEENRPDMSNLREKIEAWFLRETSGRAVNECLDISAVLATDIGLRRCENQDRVAAMKIGSKSANARSAIVIAAADGMGGMMDGAKCASLALSSFFAALAGYPASSLQERAAQAIVRANDRVFEFAAGQGGATLSAVLVDDGPSACLVHVGDSRIYSFDDEEVQRLTRDDSVAETFGGHGPELLQFVGMGSGMYPFIAPVSLERRYFAITTDGVHFVDKSALEGILTHSADLTSASEGLMKLARSHGAPDNASLALFDTRAPMQTAKSQGRHAAVKLWDPFGDIVLPEPGFAE